MKKIQNEERQKMIFAHECEMQKLILQKVYLNHLK
jgi:hypothetical protein